MNGLTKEELRYIHVVLSHKKQDFESQMVMHAKEANTSEVMRCAKGIQMIESICTKILHMS